MTIAVSVKVHDGVVLAADSAATLFGGPPGVPPGVVNVYNNANKIFNLYKGCPIGGMTWGSGSIGTASISTIAKDLRRRMMGDPDRNIPPEIDKDNYTIRQVAELARKVLFEELYEAAFSHLPREQWPYMGFMVAGYSSGEQLAEEYQFFIVQGQCGEPTSVRPTKEDAGISWSGEVEALNRLINGYGTALPATLQELGVRPDQIGPAMARIDASLQAVLAPHAMPIQDAIDLAEYLVYTTIMFYRFAPGAPTVGGPIEVAAITKHEGFKWVKRKHYFNTELNLPEGSWQR